jgi:hypothetical protein
MGYTNHEDVIKAIFVEYDITFVVEVKRNAATKATNRCPPSSPSEEVGTLHVNMLALCIDTKTIPKEGEMLEEKDGGSQVFGEMERVGEPMVHKEVDQA